MNSRRILLGGAGLLALIAVVGIASRARTPAGGGATRAIDTGALGQYIVPLLIAASLVIIPVAVYAFVSGREELASALPIRGNWMTSLMVTMTVLVLVAVLLLARGYFDGQRLTPRDSGGGALAELAERGTRTPEAVKFDVAPVIVVATLTVIALAAAIFALRSKRRGVRPHLISAQLAEDLDRTIADLRAERDPRKAVIAAYAQMERALARADLPREAAEAPREYLGRVLPEVGGSADSVGRLTSLFERAKFSPHAIGETMKEAAISALESLRDDLRRAS